jgi:hypothetical protein
MKKFFCLLPWILYRKLAVLIPVPAQYELMRQRNSVVISRAPHPKWLRAMIQHPPNLALELDVTVVSSGNYWLVSYRRYRTCLSFGSSQKQGS